MRRIFIDLLDSFFILQHILCSPPSIDDEGALEFRLPDEDVEKVGEDMAQAKSCHRKIEGQKGDNLNTEENNENGFTCLTEDSEVHSDRSCRAVGGDCYNEGKAI